MVQGPFPAVTSITDPSNVGVALIQGTQIVRAPLSGIPFQPVDADLTAIAALTPADRNFIVGNGTTWTTTNGQIPFPATQNPSADANTLDDYEEGTWSPSVTALSGTFTSVSATGSYTKIGRTVFFGATITITTNGTAATAIQITLPFTPSRAGTYYGREMVATGKTQAGQITSGSATSQFLNYDNTYPGGSGYVLELAGHFIV